MSMREMPFVAEARLAMFEVLRPSLAALRASLSSGDPAEVIAAAQALVRRVDEGEDDPAAIAECLPEKLFALPGEALERVADLAVRGVPIVVPAWPDGLSPSLAQRLRCAELLASPEKLPLDAASALDRAAVGEAPVVRAIASGLWKRAAMHAEPAVHGAAIRVARAGLEGALVAPAEAQEVLVGIARRSAPAVAAQAVSLLAESWAHRLPCPAIATFVGGVEVALAAVKLAAARGEVEQVRRAVWNDVWPSVRRAAIEALGALGEPEDVEALVAAAEDDASGLGPEVVRALRGLKRRGISADEAQARAVLDLTLGCAAIPIDATAEALSSRADALVSAIDERLASARRGAEDTESASTLESPSFAGVSKARVVAFLEALGTRLSIARLVEMAADEGDRALSRSAIRALGRLEERAAEATILARLSAEPDVCLSALRRLGGAETAKRLRSALSGKAPPWLGDALAVLVRIDPSPEVLSAAADHEAISSEALEALPSYTGLAQTEVLARIAQAPGHPLRTSSIRALGQSGGPAAIDVLGALLTDTDEAIRELANVMLLRLGDRLASPDPPLACLEGAGAPGAMILAEAALRRLAEKEIPASDAALLLDALNGSVHPRLVRRVRPLLRRTSPEIKKRAIACLGAAGAEAASWLLPSLDDERLPVARQALIAVGRAAVPGLGPKIAAWLAHPNMNLKKTAAEALASCGDPRVMKPLLDALSGTDQPGYRALLEQAIGAVAGSFQRSVLVDAMIAMAHDLGKTSGDRGEGAQGPRRVDAARGVELLASSLAGVFTAEELSALVALRPEVPQALLVRAYSEATGKLQGRLDRLDATLAMRGAAHRIPHEGDVAQDHDLRPGLARADAARRASVVRRRLREAPFFAEPSAELCAAVRAAGDRTHPIRVDLSAQEQRVLSAMLGAFDAATRDAAIGLLAGAREPAVIERVLRHLDVTGEVNPRHAAWLSIAVERRGAATARSLADHSDAVVRRRAGAVLAIAGEDELKRAPQWERAASIEARLRDGRRDEILAAMEGPGAVSPNEVAQAIAERSGKGAALELVERWVARDPASRAGTLAHLEFLGDDVAPRLRAIAAEGVSGDVRRGALERLAGLRAIPSAALRPFLHDTHPAVREASARALLDVGSPADRGYVLAMWLEGAFRGGSFGMSLDEQDVPAVAAAVSAAVTDVEQLRVFAPVGALPVQDRAPLLLALRDSPYARVAGVARDALRWLPVSAVLPRLREGDARELDVIGVTGAVPPALAELAAKSDNRDAWMDILLRFAGFGALYAGGLGERIAAWAAEDPSRTRLTLVTRLTDWFDPVRAERLVQQLSPALSGSSRETVLRAVMEALKERPPAFVARVLGRVVTPADTEAVRALAEAEAAEPGILDLLPAALAKAVARAIGTALETAGPEAARKLLGYFAARAERPSERETVLSILEREVGSPSRRVSLHAHRLLRTLAPKDWYLRATRKLLADTDAGTVRLAVRALAFGGDVESVGAIAEALFHSNAGVSRAAREGLLAMGESAIVPLERARAKLRPDRRGPIDSVLAEIRGRAA